MNDMLAGYLANDDRAHSQDILASVDSRPAPVPTGTVEDVLEPVDSCPALPIPTDDVPPSPAH